jgi:stearoyl-CoA desaturase (delta-9 desaturase)
LLKLSYLIFGAAAFQNSALKWSQDHRIHHKEVDTEQDPYNAGRGFWFSHIGWIFYQEDKPLNYDKDLVNDKLIQWQHRNYMTIAILAGIVLPTLLGWMMGSILAGFVFGAAVRVVFTHHCTFFINSLAHIWGKQTYTDENSARDNTILALLTYGEGYHNFHHRFQGDYRNGLQWYHFDPTKWLIQVCHAIGLADKLKRVPEEEIFRAKVRMQKKILLEKKNWKAEYLEAIESLRLRVEDAQQKFRAVKLEYKNWKTDLGNAGHERAEEMRLKVKIAKAEFRAAYRHWQLYTRALANA